jgi:hypothetical protein
LDSKEEKKSFRRRDVAWKHPSGQILISTFFAEKCIGISQSKKPLRFRPGTLGWGDQRGILDFYSEIRFCLFSFFVVLPSFFDSLQNSNQLNNLCKVKVIFFCVSTFFIFEKVVVHQNNQLSTFLLFCFFALTSTFLLPIVGEEDFLPNLYVTRY